MSNLSMLNMESFSAQWLRLQVTESFGPVCTALVGLSLLPWGLRVPGAQQRRGPLLGKMIFSNVMLLQRAQMLRSMSSP